MHNSTDAPEPK